MSKDTAEEFPSREGVFMGWGHPRQAGGTQRARLQPSGYGVVGQFLVPYRGVSGFGEVREEIGANVRSFRKRAGLSQEKLDKKAGLRPVYISQVERLTKAGKRPKQEIWALRCFRWIGAAASPTACSHFRCPSVASPELCRSTSYRQ